MDITLSVSKDFKPGLHVAVAHSSEDGGSSKDHNEHENREPKKYTYGELALIFALFSLPLQFFTFLILALLLWKSGHLDTDVPEPKNTALPGNFSGISPYSFYTDSISGTHIALVASTAVNVGMFSIPWFMILFSYVVAGDVQNNQPPMANINGDKEMDNLMHSLLKGTWSDLLTWIIFVHEHRGNKNLGLFRAAAGLLMTLFFVGCLKGGEIWLSHLTTTFSPFPKYSQLYPPCNATDQECIDSGSGFAIGDACSITLNMPIPDPFAPSDLVPCSVVNSSGLYQLANSSNVYETLDTGLSNFNGNFSQQNFDDLFANAIAGRNAGVEIITFMDNNTNLAHALYFNPWAAFRVGNDVQDFVATTTSVATVCKPITQACQLQNVTSPDSQFQNLSVPFNCSSIFSGDLNVAPTDGIEQFKGWDSSFYALSPSGSPHNISVISALNPFQYNLTALVSTESIASYINNWVLNSDNSSTPLPADITAGTLINAGDDRLAFALSCSSTVFDVTYSLLDGQIAPQFFNATPSDRRKAAIVKAPLQMGFGRHVLFEKAALAVLDQTSDIETGMALALSQVGMALAYGAFAFAPNVAQRTREDVVATRVPKAPLWMLVVTCSLYTAVGLVVFVRALRLKSRLDRVQARLVEKVPVGPKDLWHMVLLGKDLVTPDGGWWKAVLKLVGIGDKDE